MHYAYDWHHTSTCTLYIYHGMMLWSPIKEQSKLTQDEFGTNHVRDMLYVQSTEMI